MIARYATILVATFLLIGDGQRGRADEREKQTIASSDRHITLNMAKGEIRDALRLVAEQGGLNLVIGPKVEGKVSVYLTNASLETALRAITVSNGFTYSVEDGVISVSKPQETPESKKKALPPMVTKVFTLNAQDAQRIADALVDALTKDEDGHPRGSIRVLNENSDSIYFTQELNQLGGDLNGNNNGGSNTGTNQSDAARYRSGGGTINSRTGSGTTGTGIGGSQGSFGPARNARMLVVTDVPENVERIGELIADMDTLPPQVLIEARIVEMATNLQRQLGIDWDVNVLANGPILNHELPLQFEAGFATGSQIRRGAGGRPRSSTGLALGSIDFSNFTALLRAHEGDNSMRMLANPRLLVFNNHNASILVGERYPLLQANISDFGTVTESFDTYVPIGVQLEVTPTIMMDGRISMMVHPATSSLGDDVIGTTGLRVARINTRELDTRVIMHDGQTIVLGGLISDRKARTTNKVPGLGDIPGLSIFFRQESPAAERVDLLIFLTAIVEDSTEISARDRKVYEMYRPHFKQIQRLQDVPLHFEIPTEYAPPKPMFGDPQAQPPLENKEQEKYSKPEPEQGQILLKTPRPQANQPVSIGAASGRPHRPGPDLVNPRIATNGPLTLPTSRAAFTTKNHATGEQATAVYSSSRSNSDESP